MPTETAEKGKDKSNIGEQKPQRVFILQGGGALGAYEAGVFDALSKKLLRQDPERPLFDIIAGTSAGAINAALLVSHVRDKGTWDEAAKRLIDFWMSNALDTSAAVNFWTKG